jgi:asparagine synthase (glutamine-hydrolysing)
MCGIAGAIRKIPPDRTVPPRSDDGAAVRWVERMAEAQRHRGPDGSGLWQSAAKEVVFGHRRLAILDLSEAGAQPMVDEESGCAVTFNGEVYNFADIRRELEAQGDTFRSTSDTEVILKAYRRWGLPAVERLRGIFALGLWDPRSRAVHLVRDPMGIKPLYWAVARAGDSGEETILFASEVRALLASGAVPRRLDPGTVASYLWHGFTVGPSTMIAGVQLLPAGSILSIEADPGSRSRNACRTRQYWRLPSSKGGSTTVEDLRNELLNTVRMQLVSDVPLGVFLSGGIDSSAVAVLASEAAPGAVHTFTIGFEVSAYDERRYAEQVALAIKSRHTSVVLSEQSFQEQLPDAFTAIDQPTFDGINTYFVSRAARSAGMTVALAGTGGDELFGGYSSYAEIPRALRATRWLSKGGGLGVGRRLLDGAVSLGARFVNHSAWNVLGAAPPQTRWGKSADLLRASGDPLALYQVFYAIFTRETQALMADDVVGEAQRGQFFGLPAHVAEEWRQRIEGSDVLHAVSLLELSSFVGERLLRDTDAASMAVSLEVRVPLLDHVLAETVAGIDPARRFLPLRRKQLLRDLALGGLDQAIFERPKSGFVLPIDVWARRSLYPDMEAVFADQGLARQAGLRSEVVQTLWRSFVRGMPGIYWSRVWAIYVLLSWCRNHEVSVR